MLEIKSSKTLIWILETFMDGLYLWMKLFFGDFDTLYFTFFCMMYACHEVWEVMDQKVSKKYSQTSLQFLCAKKKRKEKKMTLDMDFYGVTILLYIQEKVPREVLIYSRSSKWPIQFGHLPANMSFIYQHHTRWHYHHNLWITLPIYWTKYRIFTNVSRSQFIEVIKSCRN